MVEPEVSEGWHADEVSANFELFEQGGPRCLCHPRPLCCNPRHALTENHAATDVRCMHVNAHMHTTPNTDTVLADSHVNAS